MRRCLAPVLWLFVSGCVPEPLVEEPTEEPLGLQSRALIGEAAHCVVSVGTFGTDLENGPALRPPLRPPRCFKMFSEALAFATQGQVVLPEGVAPTDVEAALEAWERSATFGERLAQSHVIAIEYTDKGYRGGSLTVQSEVTCDEGVISLDLTGSWRTSITSARVFGTCRHGYHYENTGLKGAKVDCEKRCAYLGEDLTGRASSIKWTR